MKRTIVLILAFTILMSACAPSSTPPTFQTEVHLQAEYQIPTELLANAPSTTMKYLIWLPEGYGEDPDKVWPLIFFLHGAGGQNNDSSFVMGYGLPEVLYKGDQPEDFPFIVISPQAFPNIPWWSGLTPDILMALLDELISIYQVDTSRIYLTGLSMGGYSTWIIATAFPGRFAALVSTSGSGYRHIMPSHDQLCSLAQTPIWAIHGALDNISAPLASEMYVVTLQKDCEDVKEVKWTLYPDTGHFETYQRAYRDPALYTWLLEHSLPSQGLKGSPAVSP